MEKQRSAAAAQGVELDPGAAWVIENVDCQSVWLLDQLLASLQNVVAKAGTRRELEGGEDEGAAEGEG